MRAGGRRDGGAAGSARREEPVAPEENENPVDLALLHVVVHCSGGDEDGHGRRSFVRPAIQLIARPALHIDREDVAAAAPRLLLSVLQRSILADGKDLGDEGGGVCHPGRSCAHGNGLCAYTIAGCPYLAQPRSRAVFDSLILREGKL